MQSNFFLSLCVYMYTCVHMWVWTHACTAHMWRSESLPSALLEVWSLQRFPSSHRNTETVDTPCHIQLHMFSEPTPKPSCPVGRHFTREAVPHLLWTVISDPLNGKGQHVSKDLSLDCEAHCDYKSMTPPPCPQISLSSSTWVNK